MVLVTCSTQRRVCDLSVVCAGGAGSSGISNGEAAEAVAPGGHDPPPPPGSTGGGPPASQPPSAHQVLHCSCLVILSCTIHTGCMVSQCKHSLVLAPWQHVSLPVHTHICDRKGAACVPQRWPNAVRMYYFWDAEMQSSLTRQHPFTV